ncbi:hypothetical protein FNV43_RR23257 [Rhamnella rubrinervis]|uniref:Fe2OG dioxygenase domain-containing protein n=1 Tax=Rhamnella rubrinervis TaxID=2594499 RepID=A0A8K0GVV0_9ROSA|nr:hypothetical protein FNV43_RR23257 [Rhamnella rubrinervis]
MENLVSNWSEAGTLPKSYVFPLGKRPGKVVFPVAKTIPVIDLQKHDRPSTIQQILEAAQHYGLFQVINHGVAKDLMDETMNVIKQFHGMSKEDKASECSKDPKRSCKLYTSTENYNREQVHYWRDALIHHCHPLEDCMQFWPQNPITYREVIGAYTVQVRKLGSIILELISEGLGFKRGYFSGEYSKKPVVLVNHYPPCPDPSLTLGLAEHCDPSLITIILQGDVPGLQVFNDGEWFVVQPLAHAFVVNVGYILQIMSNGKLKAAVHRVVTSASVGRTTASLFIYPSENSVIEPATTLVNACNPPLYRAFQYKDFRTKYISATADSKRVDEFIFKTTSSNNDDDDA